MTVRPRSAGINYLAVFPVVTLTG